MLRAPGGHIGEWRCVSIDAEGVGHLEPGMGIAEPRNPRHFDTYDNRRLKAGEWNRHK